MTEKAALQAQANTLNSQLSETDKKNKKWVVVEDENGNCSLVLQYIKGGSVTARRKCSIFVLIISILTLIN